jgi:hypothetical protein
MKMLLRSALATLMLFGGYAFTATSLNTRNTHSSPVANVPGAPMPMCIPGPSRPGTGFSCPQQLNAQ